MVFEKFGRLSFVPFTKVSEFVEHLKNGKLKATKCKKCSSVYFPPKADCFKCMSTEMEWIELSGKCTLLTYTTVHVAPAGFENFVPYTIAVAELEEGGKLLAWLGGIKEENLEIGMKLRIVVEQLPEDRIVYSLKR
ncbi:MAG: Zn-ribbon domain-containing OB-fold protein [Candidatus Thermoplasmatota archaeon]|nr:Zn-ribbon domain-containing OB-fold protein [Candidatus Thermoplasmatota archaeon]